MGAIRARRWRQEAHPGQLPPEGDWRVWYAQGGRGSGKTRAGAEAFAEAVLRHPPGEWAVVGPTFADARDTMVEHRKSGLLKVLGPNVRDWFRSNGELHVANGSIIRCDGAIEGAERIQGKELRGAWCDEIGLWRVVKERSGQERGGIKAWQESIEFAVREAPAIIYATGTPKGKQGIVRLLMDEPEGRVAFTFPSLADNKDNIDRKTYEGWLARWGGTRLGKQELEGQILEDVEGALWRLALIEELRLHDQAAEAGVPGRTVIAVDPSATTTGDETGIVAAQAVRLNDERARRLGIEDYEEGATHGLVLADRSGNYTPEEWAQTAIALYHELRADRIVAERNNGGEMVEAVMRAVDPNVPVKLVWASKGKQPRAEPVAALYEKHRVHHVGVFTDLEGEQTTWVPGEDSPNRMDALVWSLSELMLEGGQEYAFAGESDPTAPIEEPITADILSRRW